MIIFYEILIFQYLPRKSDLTSVITRKNFIRDSIILDTAGPEIFKLLVRHSQNLLHSSLRQKHLSPLIKSKMTFLLRKVINKSMNLNQYFAIHQPVSRKFLSIHPDSTTGLGSSLRLRLPRLLIHLHLCKLTPHHSVGTATALHRFLFYALWASECIFIYFLKILTIFFL